MDKWEKIGIPPELLARISLKKLKGILRKLGEPTLKFASQLSDPQIAVDFGLSLTDLIELMNKRLSGIKGNEGMKIDCPNPRDLSLEKSPEYQGKIGIFIIDASKQASERAIAKDELLSKLAAVKAQGVQVDFMTAHQYLPWAATMRLIEGKKIDSNEDVLLDCQRVDQKFPRVHIYTDAEGYKTVEILTDGTPKDYGKILSPGIIGRCAVGGYVS